MRHQALGENERGFGFARAGHIFQDEQLRLVCERFGAGVVLQRRGFLDEREQVLDGLETACRRHVGQGLDGGLCVGQRSLTPIAIKAFGFGAVTEIILVGTQPISQHRDARQLPRQGLQAFFQGVVIQGLEVKTSQ